MKRMIAAVGFAMLIAGCGQSSETTAQDFAMKACDIEWVDDAGNPVEAGEGQAKYEASEGTSYDPATESITRLKTWSESWKVKSADAAAAAQLDPAWLPLSNSASTVNEKFRTLVMVREDGFEGTNFLNQTTYTNSDVVQYNDALAGFNTQCSALASRL
jgi:hypothetical protein